MQSFQVVGNYQPKVLSERNIRRKINQIVNSLDISQHKGFVEVRDPKTNIKVWNQPYQRKGAGTRWHQDLSTTRQRNKDVFILMWSNISPTRYRYKKSKREIKVKAGDIVLIRNSRIEHKTPIEKPCGRWFARHFWGVRNWKRPNQS